MNNVRIYNQLIDMAKSRDSLEGYYERHHIVPKSMGGSDDPDNLVFLTAREHFIAHWLLYKIHGNRSMAHAWHAMSAISLGGRRYTSKSFQYAKEAYIRSRSVKSPDEDLSNPMGSGNTLGRKVIATCSDEGFEIIFSNARWAATCVKGDQSSITKCCAKTSRMHKGYFWRYADGNSQASYKKTRISRTDSDGLIVVFNNLTEAADLTDGASKGHISSCCTGKRATHAGYTWNHVSDSE